MMKAIFKRTMLLLLAVGAMVPAAPVSAQDDWVPVYDHYYLDGPNGNDVGHNRDTCNPYGIGQTAVEGSYTSYVRNEEYALCDPYGELHPY